MSEGTPTDWQASIPTSLCMGAKKSEIERRWTNQVSATISLYWLVRAR
jgi:hypothetical protein